MPVGSWKSKGTLHVHDMPAADVLGKTGAVAGWVWTCGGCNCDFTLESYGAITSKWTDGNGRSIYVGS
jgi:hypothetical protein